MTGDQPESSHNQPAPNITFGLIQTAEPGNIGSAARALGAFGFSDLLLIDPSYKGLVKDLSLAVGTGADLLQRARRIKEADLSVVLAEFDEIWGTSSRQGHRRRNEPAPTVISNYLSSGRGRLLILFGPERDGLSIDWIDRCHRLLRLPTSGGSLNLAQAVNIIAYEFRKQIEESVQAAESITDINATDSSTILVDYNSESASTTTSPETRREIMTRVESILAELAYPTRALPGHSPAIYLEPLRSGKISSSQGKWLLGLLKRLEKRLD